MIALFKLSGAAGVVLLLEMDWQSLVNEAPHFGFLGGIVGIVGLMLGAGGAILYGFTRTFDDWKPGADSPLAGLDRMIGGIVAIAIIALWLFATPNNIVGYIHLAFWLMGIGIAAFILYVGLRVAYTCPKDIIVDDKPAGVKRVWGGFWLTEAAKKRSPDVTVCKFLQGKGYDPDIVWDSKSQAALAMVIAIVLLLIVAGGGIGISAAATTAQVALTKKPARDVFRSEEVPGLPTPTPTPSPSPTPTSTPITTSARSTPESTPTNTPEPSAGDVPTPSAAPNNEMGGKQWGRI